jgi:hypothetical protein
MSSLSGSFAIYLDSNLEFENVIFNDRNKHQANLIQCCSRPEEFLVEQKKTNRLVVCYTQQRQS